MRVLMLGWELPPNNNGGLGVACLQLSEALARAGADISFVLPFKHDREYEFMKIISAFSSDKKFHNSFNVYDSWQYTSEEGQQFEFGIHGQQAAYSELVGRLVDNLEFDVIHAHDWLTFRAALLAREKTGAPLVLHVHSIEKDRSGGNHGNLLVQEIEGTALLLADHVIAVSQRTKDMIVQEYGIPADKVEVVHNSADISLYEPLEADNAYRYLTYLKSRGWHVVTNVGRLTIQKGLTHLLQSAKLVIEKEPKTIFLLVGDGEQRNELLELAADLGISKNVMFAGFQRGKKWRDAYAVADLFVMPSISEPFGLTPFEATAYGTPTLISKQSGVAEVFNSCLKVDFWDELEMANKIVAALRSEPLRDNLLAAAKIEYQRLSWDKAAAKIINRYKKVQEAVAA